MLPVCSKLVFLPRPPPSPRSFFSVSPLPSSIYMYIYMHPLCIHLHVWMVVVHVLCSLFCSWTADWMCVFWHDGQSVQHHMAQRHHLSKALVVSLMKNHHFKKVFAKGKGRTLWYGDFFNFWYEFNKWVYTKSSWVTFRFWSSSQVSAQNLHFKLHKALRLPGNLHFMCLYIDTNS